MDLKKLFEEISKLSVEEQKICGKCFEDFLKAVEMSKEKDFTEEERIEWLSNFSLAMSGIINLISNSSEMEFNDDENRMTR